MKKKLVFATNNAHKLEEIRAILGDKVEVLSLKDIRCEADIPETADTLEGNAALKAEYIHAHYGMDCFADDTGLEVEALDGAPGVYSARYAGGEGHDSEANMKKLLAELKGKENRKAQFRTAKADRLLNEIEEMVAMNCTAVDIAYSPFSKTIVLPKLLGNFTSYSVKFVTLLVCLVFVL